MYSPSIFVIIYGGNDGLSPAPKHSLIRSDVNIYG